MAAKAIDVTSVLATVREIVPKLRENGLEAEDRRWLPDENVELLEKAGVFRMATPKVFGGLEFSVADQAAVFAEIARGDVFTSWIASVWVSSAWMITLFPEELQKEIFATPDVRISGGFTPSGVLTPVEGGFVLNGSRKFNSGCRGAQWNIATSLVQNRTAGPKRPSRWCPCGSSPSRTTRTRRPSPRPAAAPPRPPTSSCRPTASCPPTRPCSRPPGPRSSDIGAYTALAHWWSLAGYSLAGYDAAMSQRISGGMVGLLQAMLRDADAELHLNSPVVSVNDDGSQVRVTTRSGKVYTGRAAVVAVPVNVWKTISFTPGPAEGAPAGHGSRRRGPALLQGVDEGQRRLGPGGGASPGRDRVHDTAFAGQRDGGQLMVGSNSLPH